MTDTERATVNLPAEASASLPVAASARGQQDRDAALTPAALFDALGGTAAFQRIVTRFYAGVADDSVLRPLYPEQDLGPAAERLRMFLVQYWGGPHTYSDLRGHPRLRMRHVPFAITVVERDAWLRHMRSALDAERLTKDLDAQVWRYFVSAADSLRNTPG